MAWPPPLARWPAATAARTAPPISTPAIERSEPVPSPLPSQAMTQAGRWKRSVRRLATRPTTPLCQLVGARPAAAAGRGRPRPAARRRATASSSICVSMALRSRLSLSSSDGDARRLHLVVGREQARAERRIADASAGIDARAQHEAQMIGRRRHGEAGGVGRAPCRPMLRRWRMTCRPLRRRRRG